MLGTRRVSKRNERIGSPVDKRRLASAAGGLRRRAAVCSSRSFSAQRLTSSCHNSDVRWCRTQNGRARRGRPLLMSAWCICCRFRHAPAGRLPAAPKLDRPCGRCSSSLGGRRMCELSAFAAKEGMSELPRAIYILKSRDALSRLSDSSLSVLKCARTHHKVFTPAHHGEPFEAN